MYYSSRGFITIVHYQIIIELHTLLNITMTATPYSSTVSQDSVSIIYFLLIVRPAKLSSSCLGVYRAFSNIFSVPSMDLAEFKESVKLSLSNKIDRV